MVLQDSMLLTLLTFGIEGFGKMARKVVDSSRSAIDPT